MVQLARANPAIDEYRLGIGAVMLGIRMLPKLYEPLLPDYFGRPNAPGTADFHLTVRIAPGDPAFRIPNSLYHDKKISPKGFTLANRLIRGCVLAGGGGMELRVPLALVCGQSIRIFEHLLHQAFHSAQRGKRNDCCLLHAAGIIHKSAGYLFVGASGKGKTTVAKLSTKDRVLNDEICLVSFGRSSVCLYGTPFNGFYPGKVEARAPLKAIFLLHQREAHRVLPLRRGEAVSGIFQQIIPPVGLDEPIDRQAHERMLEFADRLFERVPVFRLEFKRDNGFWRQIDRAMKT